MFDKYLIGAESLQNVGPVDAPTGFSFQARLGYYRGLGVSMIDDLVVTVDDAACPREAVSLDVGGGPQKLDDLLETFDRRWEFGTWATITVDKAGGLDAGHHRLGLKEVLRISYLPFPLFAEDSKDVELA